MALDQASKTSGYAIFINDKLIDYGKFTFDNENIDKRLVQIRQKVQSLIDEYDIDEIIFEDIQQQDNVANNVQTFKVLAEVLGVIAELSESLKIPHSSILASSWKSILNIEGRNRPEQKRNAQKYVNNTYEIKVTQDIADAICIGAAYIKKNSCAW